MGCWTAREADIEAIQDMGYGYLFCAISGFDLVNLVFILFYINSE